MTKHIVSIDSRYRDKIKYPNSSKFSIYLGNRIKNIKKIDIESIELPFKKIYPEFYSNISYLKNNDNFIIEKYNIKHTIKIVSNDYNSKSLVEELQNKFDKLNLNMKIENSNKNIIETIDNETFTIYFKDNKLGNILGFNEDYINVSEINSNNNTIFSNDNYYYLRINDYGNIYKINNDILNSEKIFSKIIIDFNICSNTHIISDCTFEPTINIDRFDIEFLNSMGELLNLNNIDFSFTLILETLFK